MMQRIVFFYTFALTNLQHYKFTKVFLKCNEFDGKFLVPTEFFPSGCDLRSLRQSSLTCWYNIGN